jgi:hypothetical protein
MSKATHKDIAMLEFTHFPDGSNLFQAKKDTEPHPLNQPTAFSATEYNWFGSPRPTENAGSGHPQTLGYADLERPPIEAPIVCRNCGDRNQPGRPLIPIAGTQGEWIHARHMYDDYGFCRVCAAKGDGIAWQVDDLNEADECPIHVGEFGLPSDDKDNWEPLA